jgi:DNA-binding MurR/RpiR family transcriptional regulator
MRLLRKMQEQERFSPSEQNMINYILSHKRELAELSIRDLAQRTYSSPAGIFRLCQKLGLKGYNEFKLRFISEVNRTEKASPCEEMIAIDWVIAPTANISSKPIGIVMNQKSGEARV